MRLTLLRVENDKQVSFFAALLLAAHPRPAGAGLRQPPAADPSQTLGIRLGWEGSRLDAHPLWTGNSHSIDAS
jgi:hypothetical protein